MYAPYFLFCPRLLMYVMAEVNCMFVSESSCAREVRMDSADVKELKAGACARRSRATQIVSHACCGVPVGLPKAYPEISGSSSFVTLNDATRDMVARVAVAVVCLYCSLLWWVLFVSLSSYYTVVMGMNEYSGEGCGTRVYTESSDRVRRPGRTCIVE